MKQIIFIGITILMSCLEVSNIFGQAIVYNKSNAIGSFGRYGDCTTGRGICGIDAENLNAKSATAKFCIEKENDSTLILKIFNSRISQTDETNLFGKTTDGFGKTEQMFFKMDVDLPISSASKTILNLSNEYSKILNGMYPVAKFDSYYLIELKLH